MGKLSNGILGAVSGKVGGVVGASWKGTAYIRGYSVPGASETDLQLAQRARFSYVVVAAKYFVARIFTPYYDKFLSKMSGYNKFVSSNIPKAPAYLPVPNFQVTDGPLFAGDAFTAELGIGGGAVQFGTSDNFGIDGLSTDVGIAWVRNRVTNVVIFSQDYTRADFVTGVGVVTPAAWDDATELDCGLFFAQLQGSLVRKISRNLSMTATQEV